MTHLGSKLPIGATRVDIHGVLGRLGEICAEIRALYVDEHDEDRTPDRHDVDEVIRRGLEGPLDGWACGELLRVLNITAARYYAGDTAVVDEFFQRWCLDADRPASAP